MDVWVDRCMIRLRFCFVTYLCFSTDCVLYYTILYNRDICIIWHAETSNPSYQAFLTATTTLIYLFYSFTVVTESMHSHHNPGNSSFSLSRKLYTSFPDMQQHTFWLWRKWTWSEAPPKLSNFSVWTYRDINRMYDEKHYQCKLPLCCTHCNARHLSATLTCGESNEKSSQQSIVCLTRNCTQIYSNNSQLWLYRRDKTFMFALRIVIFIEFHSWLKPYKRWKQRICDHWSDPTLSVTESLSVFLLCTIPLFLPVGQPTGQKVRELVCAKTLVTPPSPFLSFRLSDMHILRPSLPLMRICYSQIPSVPPAFCMRR